MIPPWRVGVVLCVTLASCTPAKGARTEGDVHGHHGGAMDITRAALPYRVLRAHGGQEVPLDTFWTELSAAGAVCIGETHTNPHHHWAELEIVGHLVGPGAALGMEMFQRPFQGVLDDFAAGKIDEKTLLARTAWEERWGFDWSFYRPTVALAIAHGLPLLALNAPEEVAHKVGQGGLAALSPSERASLPELVLDDKEHRAYFDNAMGEHGGVGDSKLDNFYVAQVIWDETMADGASRWVAGGDGRHVAILAGEGHCVDPAIPARMRRRGVKSAVSVQPVLDDGSSAVADALAAPINDYLFVLDATSR
jgi:uncharacterized iron-regulated protein